MGFKYLSYELLLMIFQSIKHQIAVYRFHFYDLFFTKFMVFANTIFIFIQSKSLFEPDWIHYAFSSQQQIQKFYRSFINCFNLDFKWIFYVWFRSYFKFFRYSILINQILICNDSQILLPWLFLNSSPLSLL